MSACNEGDPGPIPESGRSPGEGNGNPLQYSSLENPMDGGAREAAVHGVAKSRTQLSNFTFTFHSRQRCLEGSNIPCAHQDPETPQRLIQNCVWVSPEEVQVSSGLPRGQGLWVQQTRVWHKPSWRRWPLTHHRAARTYTGLGNRLLEGTNGI